MHKKFDHQALEQKWQNYWKEHQIYSLEQAKADSEKEYVLVEWPYPSGNLHVGHWYAFAVPDIYVRMRRMQGVKVLYPMGFDAFGLPAENAAIKNNVNPREWTEQNIQKMHEQLDSMGASFTSEMTANSTDPEYYKWTQWMFAEFFKNDIAYRGVGIVNWCPGCNTVIANEQVLPDGTCERCKSEVEKREMPQWMIKITDYADRLIDDLDTLDWPEHIKEAQRQWIGRSSGAEIDFEINSEKKHFVLLHGFTGTPEEVFFPWLKQELEAKGHTVDAPTLPNTNEPTEKEQVSYVLKNCTFTDNTVLIGHSLGCAVAMKVAQTIETPLHKLILVAGFTTPDFKDHSRNFESTFEWEFNVERIKKNTNEIIVLSARNDSAVGLEHGRKLADSFDGKLVEFDAQDDHVCGENEPEVLKQALDSISVFTTRPDTLYGVTYMVLAPEHPLLEKNQANIQNYDEVAKYIKESSKKDEYDRLDANKEKTGVKLEGITATNPANGEEIPVYIADYVLMDYGTGAIMAVPAHDERDYEFAKKYEIPIKQVVAKHFNLGTKDGVETLERGDVVDLIIEHPTDGTFLLQRETDEGDDHVHFVGGGTDGESHEIAIKRELLEETGFSNFEIVAGPVDISTCEAYRHTKDKNQRTKSHFYHIKLTNLEQQSSEIEEGKHTIEWVSKEDVLNLINWDGHINAWQTFYPGQPHSDGGTLVNSGEFDGMDSEEAKQVIVDKVSGRMTNTYRLRDWSIGRQRYWGVPIPIVYDPEGKAHPVPKEHLPWTLPEDVDFTPTGEPPLKKSQELHQRTEEIFGAGWTPEVETMDTFVDSSWYFLRYIDNQNDQEFSSKKAQEEWMPIDIYFGGAEHTTMHLLYSRFWQKALYDLGLAIHQEPYKRRINRGLILGPDGDKMSKSKGNVVDPDEHVKTVGSDTVRTYLGFMGPYEGSNYPFDLGGIAGMHRFLERVNGLSEHIQDTEENEVTSLLHKTIKKVGEDITQFKFNTAISAMMIFLNTAEKSGLTDKTYQTYLQLLAPFAPHLTDELWEAVGNKESIHNTTWPAFDPSLIADEEVTIGVQINGKHRGDITLSPEADEETALRTVKENEKLASHLPADTARVIYKPGKILNIVGK